jgi:CRISPR/Cas system-associated endonuclease Cas3-HD
MAYLMVKNANKRRQLAQEKAHNEAAFIKDILRRFDVSKTHTLRFEEVRRWLQFLADSQAVPVDQDVARDQLDVEFPGASVGLEILSPALPSKPHHSDAERSECRITDDEVEWILMLAMNRKEEGSYKRWIEVNGPDSAKLLELPPADFECSLRAWRSYSQNKRLLVEVSRRAHR